MAPQCGGLKARLNSGKHVWKAPGSQYRVLSRGAP